MDVLIIGGTGPIAQAQITEATPLRNPFWQYSRDKIAAEDALFWTFGHAAGVGPDLAHVPGDLIAGHDPANGAGHPGDKCHSVVVDTSRIKRIAPDWAPTIALDERARQVVERFDADPARRRVGPRTDALHDAATPFMRGAVGPLGDPAGCGMGVRP